MTEQSAAEWAGEGGRRKTKGRITIAILGNVFRESREGLVLLDFFTVPTIRFQILYVFLVGAHERRLIVHLAVTQPPTPEWTAHQLREAFPWDTARRFLCAIAIVFLEESSSACLRAKDD